MSRFVVRSFTGFTEFIHIYIPFFLNTAAKFELSELTLDFTFFKHIDRSNKCHNNARRIILGKPRAYWSSLYTETFAVLHKCSCELSPIFFSAFAETWPPVSGWINGFVSSGNKNLKCMLQAQTAAKLSAVNWISYMLLRALDASLQ